MKSILPLVALSLSLSALGCGVRDDDDVALTAELRDGDVSSCASEQAFPFLSEEAMEGRKQTFYANNPGDWTIPQHAVESTWGAIRRATRTDPTGADVALTPEETVRVAKAFLRTNSDLLGLTEAQLSEGTFTFDGGTASTPRRNVRFFQEGVVRGTEAYHPPLLRFANITLTVGADGSVRAFESGSSILPPSLTLCAAPRSQPDDPEVLRSVLGTELFYSPFSFLPPPPVSFGRVEAADVRVAEPVIFGSVDDGGRVFSVAWRISVERNTVTWAFFVHAETGALLHVSQQNDCHGPSCPPHTVFPWQSEDSDDPR